MENLRVKQLFFPLVLALFPHTLQKTSDKASKNVSNKTTSNTHSCDWLMCCAATHLLCTVCACLASLAHSLADISRAVNHATAATLLLLRSCKFPMILLLLSSTEDVGRWEVVVVAALAIRICESSAAAAGRLLCCADLKLRSKKSK
eukprot:COSAG06_NODE_6598_length_2860_cov_1.817095_3_plen_147_part_00